MSMFNQLRQIASVAIGLNNVASIAGSARAQPQLSAVGIPNGFGLESGLQPIAQAVSAPSDSLLSQDKVQ